MSERRLFRPYGKYFAPMVLVPPDMAAADTRTVGLLNGVDGGEWSPISPIYIAGKGLKLNAPMAWATSQTRTIRMSALEYAHGGAAIDEWAVDLDSGGVTGLVASSRLSLPLTRLHNNARLLTVKVYFKVPPAKAAVPGTRPVVQIVRHDASLATAEDLLSTSTVQYPAPATLAAYINGGAPNVFTITPDQNHTINKATYDYKLYFVDDNVAGTAFNTVLGVELVFDSILYLDKA